MSLADTARKLLSRSLSALDQRQAATKKTYRELVRAVATTPEKFTEAAIVKRLDELNADPNQFSIDVDVLLKRLEWRATLDTGPAVEKRLEEIRDKLAEAKTTRHSTIEAAKAAAKKAIDAAEAAYAEIEEALDRERKIEDRKADAINEARRQLEETAPDDAKQALADAKAEELETLVRTAGPSESITHQTAHRIGQLRLIIQRLKARLSDITFVPISPGTNFDTERRRLEQQLAAAESEMARLQADNRPQERPDHKSARAAAAEKVAAAQAALLNQ